MAIGKGRRNGQSGKLFLAAKRYSEILNLCRFRQVLTSLGFPAFRYCESSFLDREAVRVRTNSNLSNGPWGGATRAPDAPT